jgi:hypothetical protein
MVASAPYGAALGVPQNHYYFSANDFAGVLHAAQNILIDDVTGNANTKHITQALIKNQLNRCARIYAA